MVSDPFMSALLALIIFLVFRTITPQKRPDNRSLLPEEQASDDPFRDADVVVPVDDPGELLAAFTPALRACRAFLRIPDRVLAARKHAGTITMSPMMIPASKPTDRGSIVPMKPPTTIDSNPGLIMTSFVEFSTTLEVFASPTIPHEENVRRLYHRRLYTGQPQT